MSASTNKKLLQDAFAEMEKGNTKPFGALMAEDFCWIATGTTKWSRAYQGLKSVREELFAPLFEQFADHYTNTATRFIAEDEFVVVECKGKVNTKRGVPYNNTYCYVCRFADGKLRELTEYFDTELVTAALS